MRREVSTKHEVAAVAGKLDGRPLLFENIRETKGYRVVAGVCGDRTTLARAIGVDRRKLFEKIIGSIERPKPFRVVGRAPCQEVVEDEVDLRRLPILKHYEKDGGPYVTAGIVVAKDAQYGYNSSFHRLMMIGKDRFVARILPRHLDEFVNRGDREVAIAIGNHPAFLFASAVSCELGKSELEIANALMETDYSKCLTNDALVPAQCELVLEATITDEFADEGPFPDVVEAYDIIRKQRVIRVNRITHRRNPIYQALLPGRTEHRFLMGTPREATMYREISKVCECLDVRLTAGGSSWLHAAVKIRKTSDQDAKEAMEAAFRGHPSLKHVVVVDEDVDIENPASVEWAIATRSQLDLDLVVKPGELGSSLDPSADQVTRKTAKAGIDATIPMGVARDKFLRALIPGEDEIRPEDYLE